MRIVGWVATVLAIVLTIVFTFVAEWYGTGVNIAGVYIDWYYVVNDGPGE